MLIVSSDSVWFCFLDEQTVESEHMSELDRLAVISPVSEAQETNGEGTGI